MDAKNINDLIKVFEDDVKTDDISDGYHTFGELYKHRIHLFIALCKILINCGGMTYPDVGEFINK